MSSLTPDPAHRTISEQERELSPRWRQPRRVVVDDARGHPRTWPHACLARLSRRDRCVRPWLVRPDDQGEPPRTNLRVRPGEGVHGGWRSGSPAWSRAAERKERGPRFRRSRVHGSGAVSTLAAADRRSVWQQSSSAWHDAGLEWQRPAGWETADADRQRTEPIPVVSAAVAPAEAGLAAAPSA